MDKVTSFTCLCIGAGLKGAKMAASSPRVRRMARAKKKDPRLLIGIALMIASMLAGALAFSAASATTAVVAVTRDIAAGEVISTADLKVVEVNVGDAHGVYVSRAVDVPQGALAESSLSAGQLLPKGAVGQPNDSALRPVSIAIDQQLSTTLAQGDVVEVWRTKADNPKDTAAIVDRAVVRTLEQGGGLGMQETRVEVLVPASAVPKILEAMGSEDLLYVIEVPGKFEVLS